MSSTWRDTLQSGLGSAYQIRQELGGGGMSSTFIAEETALGRSVVLKVLSPDLSSGLNAERFQREIHLAARLQHAFVVPLLSAGITGGHPWYTMPLVQGESLRARIAREGALTPTATARILRDVAEALAYAHAQGVVHRDIKPDNILLSGSHALVTDFGVAKALSASTGEGAMTGTGIAIGTPAYMAPEQAAGDPDFDHRADLYALGATGYEMLTGRPLFSQRSPAQVLMAHAVETPEPLAKVAPHVPRELAALIEQLLAKHPNDRPARAQDVAEAIATMLTRWTSGEMPPAAGHVTLGRALAFWAVTFMAATGAAWAGVRWLPIPEWTLPLVAIVLAAGLPVVLLSVWLHRPARPLAVVPSVASTTAVGRIEAIARPHFTWRRTRVAAFVALAVVALTAGGWGVMRTAGIGPAATLRSAGAFEVTDRVFVSDFDSPSSDTGLGAVVTDLLRTEMGRSTAIRFVNANLRASTLRQLGRPPGARVGPAEAREFALRANAKIYVAGAVSVLGSGFLLRASIFESATGNELAAFRETASSADDIIRGVDRLGRQLRDEMGESIRDVRSPPALYWAVTPSLEAARLFTQGTNIANAGDQLTAVRLLERAVQVDTEFVHAYRRMASYYANLGNAERSAWAAERAFRHRSKLPPGQQRLVEGTYYASPTGFDPTRAADAYESAIEVFGANSVNTNNLGVTYLRLREYDKSLVAYRQAIKFDSTSAFAPLNITAAMWAAGHRDETRDYIHTTLPRWIRDPVSLLIERSELAAAMMRPDSVVALLGQVKLPGDSASIARRLLVERDMARARRVQGRLAEATRGMSRAASLSPSSDTVGHVSRAALFRADVALMERGNPAEALRILDSVSAQHPPGNASALGYRWHDVAELYARAGEPAKARALLGTYESRASASVKRHDAHAWQAARGWIAVAEKRYADAIAAFRAADVNECRVCALPPLAHAYDLAGQRDSAIAVFERYLTTDYFFRLESDARFLSGAHKRLGELYEEQGSADKARAHYERFVQLWANADPEMRPRVAEVRKRLAALRRPD